MCYHMVWLGASQHHACVSFTDESKAEAVPAPAATDRPEPFVLAEFRRQLDKGDIPVQVAAIRALTELIRNTLERTAQGLLIELREAADELQECDPALLRGKTSIAVVAGCELLVRHVTRTSKFDHSVRPRRRPWAMCLPHARCVAGLRGVQERPR